MTLTGVAPCVQNSNVPNPPDETFLHLFLLRPTTAELQTNFLLRYLPEFPRLTENEKKLFFLLGMVPEPIGYNRFVVVCSLIFQSCI